MIVQTVTVIFNPDYVVKHNDYEHHISKAKYEQYAGWTLKGVSEIDFLTVFFAKKKQLFFWKFTIFPKNKNYICFKIFYISTYIFTIFFLENLQYSQKKTH